VEAVGTLIVGAGLAGSATAMHLAAMGQDGIVVVDPDLAGARSSSELNAGGVRATWWQPVNVELCAATIDFMAAHADEFAFRANGYLWLHGPERFPQALAHLEMQNRHGAEVEALAPAEVARRWPFIDQLEGVAGATFSPRDGLVSPNAVKEHYRARARAAGVRFVDRRMAVDVVRDGPAVTGVQLVVLEGEGPATAALEGDPPDGPRERIACERIVNAAGPWAVQVAGLMGVPVPCRAVPRQLSLAASREVDLSPYGMIVDTTDCYFHAESGELILAGYSPPGDPPGYDFASEGAAFFEREIWPRLAARVSAFDRLGYAGGWTGLYELSPDNSALIGAVAGLANAYEIHSFSGRGVMQSWAAGLSLAELIATGAYRTFPSAAALAGTRFAEGALQPEDLHI
jgi:FAD-dependent oxidoreductase domain-containing protein 1